MKAMILAAGLGTRLEPLTKIRPKPLFPVLNQPLLGVLIEQLQKMGARGIIINALSVVVGFAVMFLSSFVPVRTFGFLVVVSISACLLGALVLMPALTLLLRPRFLEPDEPSPAK